ncbi:MAG: hypothetical protein FJ405_15990 [Verrucomicrobia bacterium]|nr:hypothetical protein [Verrucomicrobiota bacterium]
MEGLKLWHLAILFGFGFAALNAYGLINPVAFGEAARRFPRHGWIGYPLMIFATFWFLHYVRQENVQDFVSMKPFLYALFLVVGFGACAFLRDFLPVRAVAALLLLSAKIVTDAGRWHPSDWRVVLIAWAYVWVIAGMWLTVSPWRLRDWIHWATSTPGRTRTFSGMHVAFGLFVCALGFTILRSADSPPRFTDGTPVPPPVAASI